jgi:hypothetical protein
LNCVIAGLRFPGCSDVAVLEDAMDGSQYAPASGAAQRTAAAGLRPPPLAGLIERVPASVNAFQGAESARKSGRDRRVRC